MTGKFLKDEKDTTQQLLVCNCQTAELCFNLDISQQNYILFFLFAFFLFVFPSFEKKLRLCAVCLRNLILQYGLKHRASGS